MEHKHNVTRYRFKYETLVPDTPVNSKKKIEKIIGYNLRIIQEYFQSKIGQKKNKNIQPGPEKQHSYKKIRV